MVRNFNHMFVKQDFRTKRSLKDPDWDYEHILKSLVDIANEIVRNELNRMSFTPVDFHNRQWTVNPIKVINLRDARKIADLANEVFFSKQIGS